MQPDPREVGDIARELDEAKRFLEDAEATLRRSTPEARRAMWQFAIDVADDPSVSDGVRRRYRIVAALIDTVDFDQPAADAMPEMGETQQLMADLLRKDDTDD